MPALSGYSSAVTTTKSRWTGFRSRYRTDLDSMTQPLSRRAFLALGAIALGAAGGLAGIAGVASRERPTDQRIVLGDLVLQIRADPWRLSLLGPRGDVVWDEAADQTLAFRTSTGQTYRARRLASISNVGDGVVQMVAETDDPSGGAISVEVRQLGP